MNPRIMKAIVTTAVITVLALVAPSTPGQQDIKGKPTASGQMKQGGKEIGKAGKSLGGNVKHGRVVRGGKRFGKHMGYAGRHIGSGTKKAVKKAVKP
jgi:hypothetical protein